jgi:hypothetical protein
MKKQECREGRWFVVRKGRDTGGWNGGAAMEQPTAIVDEEGKGKRRRRNEERISGKLIERWKQMDIHLGREAGRGRRWVLALKGTNGGSGASWRE